MVRPDNTEDNENLKKLASKNLTEDYDVKDLLGLNPRVIIVGISDKFDDVIFLQYVIKQNQSIFKDGLNDS